MKSDEALIEGLGVDGLETMEPINARVSVAASAVDVWSAISESGNLLNIHPFCERNAVERWDGARSRDHVYYYSGVHYQREFLDWFDGVGYDLVLGPPEARTALVRWRIAEPAGPVHAGLSGLGGQHRITHVRVQHQGRGPAARRRARRRA